MEISRRPAAPDPRLTSTQRLMVSLLIAAILAVASVIAFHLLADADTRAYPNAVATDSSAGRARP